MMLLQPSPMTLLYIFNNVNLTHFALLQLEGPCVLQLQKVRNISASKDHAESQGAPRMLRLQMTDGHTTCVGIEYKHLSKIR